jgi:hypothetical protein
MELTEEVESRLALDEGERRFYRGVIEFSIEGARLKTDGNPFNQIPEL